MKRSEKKTLEQSQVMEYLPPDGRIAVKHGRDADWREKRAEVSIYSRSRFFRDGGYE